MFNLVKIANAAGSEIITKNPALKSILDKVIVNIVSPVIGLMFLLAFVYFVYGVFEMIAYADDADKRKTGQDNIIWAVVGMFIMISVYGIIRLIGATVGISDPFA